MQKRFFLRAIACAAVAASATTAMAQDKFKIGLILPMTGPFASTGKQIEAAARLYMAQNGDMVAGKKVELIVKDDTSAPDVTKRIAQEMVVNDKVSVRLNVYNLFDKDFLEYAQYAPNAYAALYNNMLEGRRLWVTANLSF